MDLRARFETLLRLVDRAEWTGAVSPDGAHEWRRAILALRDDVARARYAGNGSLPPLLRQVSRAQELLSAQLN